MDKPLGIGYRCQYVRAVGHGQDRREVALSYQIIHSPYDGVCWLYTALRSLPTTSKGGFFESRGWIGVSEDIRAAIRTMTLGGQVSAAFLTEDGQVQLSLCEVPLLPLAPGAEPSSPPPRTHHEEAHDGLSRRQSGSNGLFFYPVIGTFQRGPAAATMSAEQSFDFHDPAGYGWHVTVATGRPGPTVHAPNCALGSIDAAPGMTNVPVKMTVTSLMKDRSEPVPVNLSLQVPDRWGEAVFIGPDDQPGFSCSGAVSIGRWFKPSERVTMTGYIRNIPDPVPAGAVAQFRDGAPGDVVGPTVKLAQ